MNEQISSFRVGPRGVANYVKNLRFYAGLFREQKWGTDVIGSEVFSHTLEEIAYWIEIRSLQPSELPLPTPERLREIIVHIGKWCRCKDNSCREMRNELRALADALEGKRATEP